MSQQQAARLRPGDRVRCTDAADGMHFLAVGKVYTVASTQMDLDGQVRINLRGVARAWEASRFQFGPQS